MSHGHRWNLRKIASFSIQKLAHPSGINLKLAAETGEFSQVPSLSMGVHGTLRYLNLTFLLEWTTSLDTSSRTLFVRICVGMSTSRRTSSYVITSDCY